MDGARLDTRRFIDGFLEARVPGASPFSISVEPDEPDKAVNTEMAISHKNVGTEDNDLGHVGFAQTTAGAGEKPWLLKNCFGSIRTRSDKSWRRNDGNEGTFGIFQ